jgi:uncharacterized protein (UPF0276 family)
MTQTSNIRGVGFQFNPSIVDLGWTKFDDCPIDFAEVLLDSIAAPLDCGYVMNPHVIPVLEQLAARYPLLAHSNYGGEFGFEPLDETAAVRRHAPLTAAIGSPWVADHLFYGDTTTSRIWSSPVQFSKEEVVRIGDRAAALQDLLGVPLLHEDAFFYAPFPGSDIAAAEFVAGLVEHAQTHLLLDLHNVHTNDVNHDYFDAWRYLETIPLDRVMEIHIAGGQWLDGWYHDFHNGPVPDQVWTMLEWVVPRAPALRAIVLEMQGPAHSARSRPVADDWPDIARADLQRARDILTAAHGQR